MSLWILNAVNWIMFQKARSTKSRSIKWTLDELKAGRKMIPVKSKGFQLEELTLKQAIASQSRIKVDFI